MTGGLRYFDNETVNDTILGFPLPPDSTSPAAPQSKDQDDDILIKLNASWNFDDSNMAYATYFEGYRHGGAQAVPSLDNGDPFGEPNAEAIRTFSSDSVQSYEIGIKGGYETFQYTANAFYVDWQDPQLNTTSVLYGFYLAANGDEASTKGIELEIEGNLADSFHYRAGYTYVDAQLEKDFISPQTGGIVAPEGSTLPGAPENVLSLNVDYTWQLGSDIDLVAAADLYYQSDSETSSTKARRSTQTFDSFTLIGASVSLVSGRWRATLYGRNLTDEAAPSGSFPASNWSYDTGIFEGWYGNGNRQFIVQPTSFGLKLGYRF